ncbi:MAG: O-antigen ligase family protein [Minisyncoccia bacterium]
MKYIERAYPWLLLSPVLLPVVIAGGLIYPYLVPKTLSFYAISFLAFGVFAILAANGRTFFWSRLWQPETWFPAALLALAYIASASGMDFYQSFWSLFVRGDGLLMLTCAVGSYYLILLYADRAFFERLLRAVAVIGTFVAVYGIGEWMLGGGSRIGGLLGNAEFFACYLGIALFATLAAAESLPRAWRNAAYAGAALQIIAIVLSATRGSILALLVVALVYLAYAALKGKGKRRAYSAGLLAALVVFGGLFFAFRGELAKSPFAPIARVAAISASDADVASRLFIWKNMAAQIERHPWLGIGSEHIDALFNNFYDPTQIEEEWFDRSHNAFLDYFAQYGIGGLLLYIAIIGSFFTAAAREARRGSRRVAGIFALLAVLYAVQNFFVFDTVSSFWLLLALLATLTAASLGKTSREAVPLPSWTRYVSWIFAVVLIALLIPVSICPALAAYDLAHAYGYQILDPAKSAAYLSEGYALHTYGNLEYGYEAYDMYAYQQSEMLTGAQRANAYQTAVSILTSNFGNYTYDARTALDLSLVFSLAPQGAAVDQKLYSSALERAIRLSPKRPQSWYIVANASIAQANTYPPSSSDRIAGYNAAAGLLSQYIALVPNLSMPHFLLAQLDFASGDAAAAAAEAAKGKQYYKDDLETARHAAGYYENVKDWTDAAFFLREIVRLSPTDTASLYDLAKVLYLSGNPAEADAIVIELRTTHPEILPTDQNFLAAITAYESRSK